MHVSTIEKNVTVPLRCVLNGEMVTPFNKPLKSKKERKTKYVKENIFCLINIEKILFPSILFWWRGKNTTFVFFYEYKNRICF